jgi:hypothetical protein
MDIWPGLGLLDLCLFFDKLLAGRLFELDILGLGSTAAQAGFLGAGVATATLGTGPLQFEVA